MSDLFTYLQLKDKLAAVIIQAGRQAAGDCEETIAGLARRRDRHQARVLAAFEQAGISDFHFGISTGYGYDDAGRDALDVVTARILAAEAALVREQFVSGTHAIATALFGILRPGDELLSATGTPYDTLAGMIGLDPRQPAAGNLREFGITFRQVDLLPGGGIDLPALIETLRPNTRMVFFQRSRGYSLRPALSAQVIGEACRALHHSRPDLVCFVDNCYGELVEAEEPSSLGADLIAGSLIKNLGGGLAPTGGYLAGRQGYVTLAATRLTAPGIGAHVGSSPGGRRLYFQGLFQAPQVVFEALAGAVFAARFFDLLGFAVTPRFDEARKDIIQAITLGSPQRMIAFCEGLHKASPVDSHLTPQPAPMPGYGDKVIMAGGTFIQGATSELSADGPLREPYVLYLQGGLAQTYVRIGVLRAAQALYEHNLLPFQQGM
ncbi:MAG: methionine gamma-lyase family protein [Heliobacteriaceae bacterium]|nr:methionine gamma-lyase family protein [Heliobacteriaceae bacterium]MDD4586778.1 methionine gamma-lyase family protein [Heliobacteriaceae bacterium]